MTVAYTVGPRGNLISQRRSGSTYYHLYDQLGSTRKLLDSNQGTTDSYSYYAFGEVRTSSGSTTNPFRFVGRLGYYSDASTPFQYLRARYYGPGYGRFWSADRYRGLPAPRYLYVANRPVVGVDPLGLWSSDERCNDLLNQAYAALNGGDCQAANNLTYDFCYQCAGKLSPIWGLLCQGLKQHYQAQCHPVPCQPPLWWGPPAIGPRPWHRCTLIGAFESSNDLWGGCHCFWGCDGTIREGDVAMFPWFDCESACYHKRPWCQ